MRCASCLLYTSRCVSATAPVLQTGYLEVEAVDADTLRITRCARDGKDVFGEPLAGKAAVVKVSRK